MLKEKHAAIMPASIRASVSFFAMFIGWGASMFAYALVSSMSSSGRVTDFGFTVFWSALFHFVAWGVCVLPIVLAIDPRHRLFHPLVFPFVGAVLAVLVAPVVTLGLVLASWYYFLAIPLTSGFFTGFVYALTLLTWTLDPTASSPMVRGVSGRKLRARTSALFWMAPVLLILAFTLVVWPALERYAPGSIYRMSTDRAKRRMEDRALEAIRIGERVEDLDRQAPGYFPVDNRYVTHNPDQLRPPFWQRRTSGGVEYRVYFREGVVSRLMRIDHRERWAEEVTAQGTQTIPFKP